MVEHIVEKKAKAMIANTAWQLVNNSFLKTSAFRENSNEDVLTKLANNFNRCRSAIYHGKVINDNKE